jgi:hypothetical protein
MNSYFQGNRSLVEILNKKSSRYKRAMILLRDMVLQLLHTQNMQI